MAKRDPLWVPSSGGAPSYDATELRQMFDLFQGGVVGSGDFKVTPGSGLALSSAAGEALVTPTGTNVPAFPGRYLIGDDAAEGSATWEGGPIPANPNANPRLDAVVLRVFDAGFTGSRREWVRQYVPGVASAGAALGGTLPTLPDSSRIIAEVLVPANATTATAIPSGNIRDRRRWARGAYHRILRTTNESGGSNYSTTSTTATPIDATNLNPRIECSGVPLRVTLRGRWGISAGAPNYIGVQFRIDGSLVDMGGDEGAQWFEVNNHELAIPVTWDIVPTPGSHRIAPYWFTGGTAVLLARTVVPAYAEMTIEEIVRPIASND